MREYKAYLNDILEAIRKIETYTSNIIFKEFVDNELGYPEKVLTYCYYAN